MNHDIHRGKSHETIRKPRQVQMPLVLFEAKIRSSQNSPVGPTVERIVVSAFVWFRSKNPRFQKKTKRSEWFGSKEKLLAHGLLLFFFVVFFSVGCDGMKML